MPLWGLPPVTRRQIPDLLLCGAFALAPWLCLLSSPVFPRLGVWFQSEPLVIGLIAMASLCALGLCVAGSTTDARTGKRLSHSICHPAVIFPFLIFIWSLAMMPLVPSPLLSLYGAPQTGVGAIWFLALAAMTGGFRYLFFSSFGCRHRQAMAGYLLISALVLGYLGGIGAGQWRPFFYTDYLAFVGIFVWVGVVALAPGKPWLVGMASVVCLALIVISENRAGYVAVAWIAIVCPCVIWMQARFTRTHRMAFSLSPVVLLISVTLAVAVIRYAPFWPEIPEFIRNTLKSRALMLDVVSGALAEHPLHYLTGEGWGMFSQALLQQIPHLETSLYHYGQDTINPLWRWDALWRFDFDSHNLLAESALGGGVPVVVLVLAWLASVIATARRRLLAAAMSGICAYVLVAGIWFQMPVSAPFMAIALAALSGRACGPFRWSNLLPVKYARAGLLAVSVVLIGAAVDYGLFAVRAASAVDENFSAPLRSPAATAGPVIDDRYRGQYHFSEIMRTQLEHLEELLKSGSPLESWQQARLQRLMDEADQRVRAGAPLHVGTRALNARSDFVFLDRSNALGAAFQDRLQNWGSILELVLTRYPQREDLAVAYFLWLLKTGAETQLLERSENLLAHNQQSPIGLWFSGVVLLNDSSRAQAGMARLRQALANGIEMVMPVDQTLKKAILPQ